MSPGHFQTLARILSLFSQPLQFSVPLTCKSLQLASSFVHWPSFRVEVCAYYPFLGVGERAEHRSWMEGPHGSLGQFLPWQDLQGCSARPWVDWFIPGNPQCKGINKARKYKKTINKIVQTLAMSGLPKEYNRKSREGETIAVEMYHRAMSLNWMVRNE